LGATLDRYDVSEHEYQKAESKYAKLFYRACDFENAVLARPIASIADIIAKIRIMHRARGWLMIKPTLSNDSKIN
jgi:hypothetical protein